MAEFQKENAGPLSDFLLMCKSYLLIGAFQFSFLFLATIKKNKYLQIFAYYQSS